MKKEAKNNASKPLFCCHFLSLWPGQNNKNNNKKTAAYGRR